MYIGNEDYIKQIQAMITKEADLSEIPVSQRRPMPKSLDFYAQKYNDRDEAMLAAYQSGGYSMKDLAKYFDLHYTSVSRIINGKYYAQ